MATSYGVRRRYLTPVKRATFVIGTDRVVHRVVASEWRMDVHADEALAALRTLEQRAGTCARAEGRLLTSCASSTSPGPLTT